jgi:hypothetical protein
MPKFSFSPQISLGNILAMLTMIGALWGFAQSQGADRKTIEQHTVEIISLQAQAAEAAKQAEADRLFMRETLAEVKTDVGYLRRAEEENRRQERTNSGTK